MEQYTVSFQPRLYKAWLSSFVTHSLQQQPEREKRKQSMSQAHFTKYRYCVSEYIHDNRTGMKKKNDQIGIRILPGQIKVYSLPHRFRLDILHICVCICAWLSRAPWSLGFIFLNAIVKECLKIKWNGNVYVFVIEKIDQRQFQSVDYVISRLAKSNNRFPLAGITDMTLYWVS